MVMAQTAENVGNCAEAYSYYTRVIEQDPTHWKAFGAREKLPLGNLQCEMIELRNYIKLYGLYCP